MKALETPILFLVFNRPDTTRKVFERISEIKPKYLYLAADGPRPGNDSDKKNTAEVREIFKSIDWDCKLTTLYREENLGCKLAVSSGITWFFEQVEEGIILEDDILPDLSFFDYCSQLLALYRTDERIMHISGFNVCVEWKSNKQSYHFSWFGSIWGWASWRRAWKYYDLDIKQWQDDIVKKKILQTYFPPEMAEERRKLYDDLYNGKIDTWDYQWTFCRLLHEGLSIIPAKNLVENIGYESNATHSTIRPEWMPSGYHKIDLPLKLRHDVQVDSEYDERHNAFASGRYGHLLSKTSGFLNNMSYFRSIFRKINRKLSLKEKVQNYNTLHHNADYNFGPDINIELIGGGKPTITIGTGTYINGMKIYCWDSNIKISFGKYCSIADNVIITAGGEHEKESVSNYPFIKKFNRTDLFDKQKVRYKGDIVIGNDVWIGNNVSILSGVHIGDGAVLGAGSNVVKNIEPYAIAAGNPAREIKKRFDNEDVASLLSIKWWDWPIEKIMDNLQLFDNVKLFISKNSGKIS